MAIALLDSVPITRDLGTRKILDYSTGVLNTTLPIIKSITSTEQTDILSKIWSTLKPLGPLWKTGTEVIAQERTKKQNENIKANLADRLFSRVLSNYGYNPRDDNIQLEYDFDDPDIFKTKESGQGIHFKWKVYNKTVWEALKEVSLYTGSDTIVTTKLYYEGMPWELGKIRETLYIGPRDGYYKATDSDLSYFGKIDNNNYLYRGKRLVAASTDKNTGYPIVDNRLPDKYRYWETYNKNLSLFPKVTYLTPNFPNTQLKADGTVRENLKDNIAASLFDKLYRRDSLAEVFTQNSNISMGTNPKEVIEAIKSHTFDISVMLKTYLEDIKPLIEKYDYRVFKRLKNLMFNSPLRKLNNTVVTNMKEDYEIIALQLLSGFMFLKEGTAGDYYTMKIKYSNGKTLDSRPLKLLDLPIFFLLFDETIANFKLIKKNKQLTNYIEKLRKTIKDKYYGKHSYLGEADKESISYFSFGLVTEDPELLRIIGGETHPFFKHFITTLITSNLIAWPVLIQKMVSFGKKKIQLHKMMKPYFTKFIPKKVIDLDYYYFKEYIDNNIIKIFKNYRKRYQKMLSKYPDVTKVLEKAYKDLTMVFTSSSNDTMPAHPQYLPVSRMHYVNSDMIITNNIHVSSENIANKIILTYSKDPAIYELSAKKFKKQTMVQADPNIDPDFIKPKIVYANNIDYNHFSMLKYSKKLKTIGIASEALEEVPVEELEKVKKQIKNIESEILKIEASKSTLGNSEEIAQKKNKLKELNQMARSLQKKIETRGKATSKIKKLYKDNWDSFNDYFNVLKKENGADYKGIDKFSYIYKFNKVIKDIKASEAFALLPRCNLIANRLLADSLKDMYQGKLAILGKSDIEPFDIIILDDKVSFMSGVFEVKDVTTTMNTSLGYITTITPQALTSFRNSAFVDELSDISNYYKSIDNTIKWASTGAASLVSGGLTAFSSKNLVAGLLVGAVAGGVTFGIVQDKLKVLRLGQALGMNPIEVCPLFQYGIPLTAGLEGATFATFKAGEYTKKYADIRSLKYGL
ncbi:MAG: hypothetical protein ACTSQY_10450 [Candidatus Odinarchaeia archaeon]